ncbi:ATP synthase subunit c family protein [Lactococcus lactis]
MHANSELEGKLRGSMFMGIAFVEVTFFIALAMAFLFPLKIALYLCT